MIESGVIQSALWGYPVATWLGIVATTPMAAIQALTDSAFIVA